ncbi:Retrovirus-related Pol polyprotein from transposon TNT 1-94 [Gossypium australe]|uniref:Retrovirus-related Pol polyprotein from transposon TNT 1-94 n=1 Tax=Gossypium australe TaxID=47621 RepID=A0A5B6V865_9ROSI|nr:Retrovirus-related Pol polyprotein from transposon TNT 1-94 [Gossypium australe]
MTSASFSSPLPSVFNGENYHICVVKMKTYLQAYELWEVVNTNVELAPLMDNATVTEIKHHGDERAKRYKAMIMAVVNNIRLLGEEFVDSKVVEKVITTLLERAKKSSRREEHVEEALRALSIEGANPQKHKGKKVWIEKKEKSMQDDGKKKYSPYSHYQNLLSIGQLLEKSYNVVFKNYGYIIFDSMGYANYKSFSRMCEVGLVKEIISTKKQSGIYDVCQLGKQVRLPFPANKAWRAHENL